MQRHSHQWGQHNHPVINNSADTWIVQLRFLICLCIICKLYTVLFDISVSYLTCLSVVWHVCQLFDMSVLTDMSVSYLTCLSVILHVFQKFDMSFSHCNIYISLLFSCKCSLEIIDVIFVTYKHLSQSYFIVCYSI